MVKKTRTNKKGYNKTKSKGKSAKPMRKRQEIKREHIRKRALIRKMKYITTLVILLISMAAVVIFYQTLPNENNINNNDNPNGNGGDNIGTEVGQTAPDFELTDIDGKGFSLVDYRGSIIILDFMADSCQPCHYEIEHLKEVHYNYSSKGVEIISIGVDNSESAEQLNNNVKEAHDCDWRFAAGGAGVGNNYDIEAIPTIYIIDKQGVISYENTGLTDYSTLSYELDKLV